LISTTLS